VRFFLSVFVGKGGAEEHLKRENIFKTTLFYLNLN
jgi:hypothetical protein